MTHPAEAGFRSLLTRSQKWMSETSASTLLSASFVFYALGEKSLFPFPFLTLFFWTKENTWKNGTKQKSLTLYVQLSAYPWHLFALPIFGPTKCQEFFIKGFFISYLPRAAEMAICPCGGRGKLGMVLSSALQASCCSLICGQSSFCRCPQFLLWSGPTACRLLLKFCSETFHMTRWPTYLSLPVMGCILAYLALPFQG